MLVHFRIDMAIAAAQLCFVIIFAINAFVMFVFFAAAADHDLYDGMLLYFRTTLHV